MSLLREDYSTENQWCLNISPLKDTCGDCTREKDADGVFVYFSVMLILGFYAKVDNGQRCVFVISPHASLRRRGAIMSELLVFLKTRL